MKDVSVVNSWMLSQTGTKAELIRLFSPNAVAGSRGASEVLVCGVNADSIETLSAAYRAGQWLSTGKPFHVPHLRESIGTRLSPPVAGAKIGVLKEPLVCGCRLDLGLSESPMAQGDDQEHDRLFTLSEANHLIPQLNTRLTSVRQAKAVLTRTKEDIRKASARAEYGGGSTVGPLYISSLQQISTNLQAIQEMGVLVKDLEMGLCDFPHLRDGRVVFLCWKFGEQEIKWWHETSTGYKDRCPLEDSA